MFVPAAQLEANFESVYYFCLLLAAILPKLVIATLVALCVFGSKEPVISSTNQAYFNTTIKPVLSSNGASITSK